jgi:hypothetical protein
MRMATSTKVIGIFFALLLLDLSDAVTIAVQLSKEDGDRLERKIDEIAKNGAAPRPQPKRTPVSESEINSYLNINFKQKIPQGLTNPEIAMPGNGALAGRVVVDLDEFNRSRRSQGLMDPLSYLSGKVPVTARGSLRAQNGKGRFQLGSAEIHGIALPREIVQELVSYFSRTSGYPNGFDIDAPFDLPAKIREIAVDKGEAVVVQ